MSNEVKFANGLIVKPRHPNCPDYVIANLSIKCEEFEQTMKANHVQGWLNVQLKVSGSSGKPYAQIDEWRPQPQQYPQDNQQQGYSQPQRQAPPPPPPFNNTGQQGYAPHTGNDPMDEIPFA